MSTRSDKNEREEAGIRCPTGLRRGPNALMGAYFEHFTRILPKSGLTGILRFDQIIAMCIHDCRDERATSSFWNVSVCKWTTSSIIRVCVTPTGTLHSRMISRLSNGWMDERLGDTVDLLQACSGACDVLCGFPYQQLQLVTSQEEEALPSQLLMFSPPSKPILHWSRHLSMTSKYVRKVLHCHCNCVPSQLQQRKKLVLHQLSHLKYCDVSLNLK